MYVFHISTPIVYRYKTKSELDKSYRKNNIFVLDKSLETEKQEI